MEPGFPPSRASGPQPMLERTPAFSHRSPSFLKKISVLDSFAQWFEHWPVD